MTVMPHQPELRAFIIYERLPAGCIAHPVTDDESRPHLAPGDLAVVDTSDRRPMHGELFLIEYGRASGRATRNIVELWQRRSGDWYARPYNRPRSAAEGGRWARRGQSIVCSDGPYADDDAGLAYLSEKLIGRVIGILEPTFAEPKRFTLSTPF